MTPAAQRYLLRLRTFAREWEVGGPWPERVGEERCAEVDALWGSLPEPDQDEVEALIVSRIPTDDALKFDEFAEYVDVPVVMGATWPPRKKRLRMPFILPDLCFLARTANLSSPA